MVAHGPSLSRRRLIGLAGAGAAGALLAGCGDDGDESADAGTRKADRARQLADVEVLNAVLEVEFEALMFWRAHLPLLRGAQLRAARDVAAQVGKHTDGLSQAIRDLDGAAAKRGAYRATPRRGEAALRLGVPLAERTVAACIDAIPKLSDGRLRATVAAIATSAAEHPLVLRSALGESPQPAEFVEGRA